MLSCCHTFDSTWTDISPVVVTVVVVVATVDHPSSHDPTIVLVPVFQRLHQRWVITYPYMKGSTR